MLCQNLNKLFLFFGSKTFQINWILLFNPKCYLACCFGMEMSFTWEKCFQFSCPSTSRMKKFLFLQTPDMDLNGAFCPTTDLPVSRAASLCFSPFIKKLVIMVKWSNSNRKVEPKSRINIAAVPSWRSTASVIYVSWHNIYPDAFSGWPRYCHLLSALGQCSPPLLRGACAVLWKQSLSIYLHNQKRRQENKKRGSEDFCVPLPQVTGHAAQSTAATCCSCFCLLGTAHPARASSYFRRQHPYHTGI